MKKLSDKGKRVIEIIALVLSIAGAWIFWETFVVYPIKLFVVLLHEISHLLSIILTGGMVKEIQIDYDIGGSCIFDGGNDWLSALSGYLGSLLLGSIMFLSANNVKFCKFISFCISLLLAVIAVVYIKSVFGVLFTVGFAVILFLLIMVPFDFFRRVFIKILGMLSCLYILFDVKNDLLTFEYKDTDALVLEKFTSVPAIYWGVLIFLITLITLYYLLKFSFRKLTVDEEVEETEEVEDE